MKIIIKTLAIAVMLWLLITCVLLFIYGGEAECQTQPYQKETTAKYVDTTVYDTVACPGLSGVKQTGIVTNESYTVNLIVYFAKRDSSVRDTNTYTLVQPRSKVRFSFYGNKIFRMAEEDSAFSQVIFGDDIDISISDLTVEISNWKDSLLIYTQSLLAIMQQPDSGHYWFYDTINRAVDTLILSSHTYPGVRIQGWWWSDSTLLISTNGSFSAGNTFLMPGGSWNWNYYAAGEFGTLYIKKYSGLAGEVKWGVDFHWY